MISSNSQHKIHRLVPRRKVKSGSLADIFRGDKSDGAAVETSFASQRMNSSTRAAATDVATAPARRHEITPDKSPKPPQTSDSSSDDESEDERTKLISSIDTSKLSPGINPSTMSITNYSVFVTFNGMKPNWPLWA
jgi:hypothetical protein